MRFDLLPNSHSPLDDEIIPTARADFDFRQLIRRKMGDFRQLIRRKMRDRCR